MAVTKALAHLPPPTLLSIPGPKPCRLSFLSTHCSALPVALPIISLPAPILPRRPQRAGRREAQSWRICAAPEEALPVDATTPLDNSQQLVSTGDDGFAGVVSVLVFLAFITLCILTIGVIYLAVTDFLEKRERERLEKEEAEKSKKKDGNKGKVVRARAGPRGFGQKIDDYEADD